MHVVDMRFSHVNMGKSHVNMEKKNPMLTCKQFKGSPHKECAEIRKAAWKEIQQLIEMSVGVLFDERQAQAIEKDKKVQVLRSKMVYKRKYEISPTDGKE
jgi:hypothetical protein